MNAMMRPALLLCLIVSCVNAACPSNFVASITIPGKCYYLTATKTDFFSAINYCRNLTYGADILSIANGFENSEVVNLLQSRRIPSGAWVGNAFYDNKSHWIATAAGSSNYSNWGSGIYNGNIALIDSIGSWDYTNDGIGYSICQIFPNDSTTFPPPQITCPAGWTPSLSVRGKCYRNIDYTDFFSATRECLTTRIGDSHAELVTLTSQFEMMELDAIGYYQLWASLTSWEEDGKWHWVETLHPTDYFGPYGPPSTSGGNCAYIDKDSNLQGVPCWEPTSAVCQYFPDEPPAPTLPGLFCPQDGIASITKPGTCYYFLEQGLSFQSARSACQALNAGFIHNDLFVPRTVAEYGEFEAIMLNQAFNTTAWFGLANSNGNWGWISDQPSNITNMWCDGQPDTSHNPTDQCGFVNSSSGDYDNICWTAGDCTHSYAAICQSTNTF